MSEITFGRLTDLLPREAWKHEALAFTPWLAENIDHLSEVVGIPLEITGTEIAVETFAADILARNPSDGTVVLIENQLEQTDHTHLGQIMTYLAGLEAHTVIWVAPKFREPHLSAIRWLNQHTADGFSFFAVRLRVVRISDSPFAPIFEVVEKPSGWERTLKEAAKPVTSSDPESPLRAEFWDFYAERSPEIADVKPKSGWNYWLPLADGRLFFTTYIAQRTCGVYIRPPWSSDRETVAALLLPFRDELERELDAEFDGSKNHFLVKKRTPGFGDREQWPALIDWFEQQRRRYTEALENRLREQVDGQ
ncbi:MAG: DUF4268 domain-containing protein [Rhizobiaceae bacterium]|nr:DUF4268 domain-containing protein [Rhizobiaceae bacterium]MCV0407225.1 DUF4268 domain-containing protein [Rhizobiaceae bacterium]